MSATPLPIHVINLDRRPDRLAFMARQLDDMGLAWRREPAVDARTVPVEVIERHVDRANPLLRMGPGSQACLVSNATLWERIAEGDAPAAIILQDDVSLSPDFAAFARTPSWLSQGIDLVQLEKYGRPSSRRLVGSAPLAVVGGSQVRALYSRTGGGGAYVITREAAGRALAAAQRVRYPVDHFLFNPNISPFARSLRIAMAVPAVARQAEFASDIQRTGQGNSLAQRLRRGWFEINLLPRQLLALASGRARFVRVGFAGG